MDRGSGLSVNFAVKKTAELQAEAERSLADIRSKSGGNRNQRNDLRPPCDEELALNLLKIKLEALNAKLRTCKALEDASPEEKGMALSKMDAARRDLLAATRECAPHIGTGQVLVRSIREYCEVSGTEVVTPRNFGIAWRGDKPGAANKSSLGLDQQHKARIVDAVRRNNEASGESLHSFTGGANGSARLSSSTTHRLKGPQLAATQGGGNSRPDTANACHNSSTIATAMVARGPQPPMAALQQGGRGWSRHSLEETEHAEQGNSVAVRPTAPATTLGGDSSICNVHDSGAGDGTDDSDDEVTSMPRPGTSLHGRGHGDGGGSNACSSPCDPLSAQSDAPLLILQRPDPVLRLLDDCYDPLIGGGDGCHPVAVPQHNSPSSSLVLARNRHAVAEAAATAATAAAAAAASARETARLHSTLLFQEMVAGPSSDPSSVNVGHRATHSGSSVISSTESRSEILGSGRLRRRGGGVWRRLWRMTTALVSVAAAAGAIGLIAAVISMELPAPDDEDLMMKTPAFKDQAQAAASRTKSVLPAQEAANTGQALPLLQYLPQHPCPNIRDTRG